MKRKFCVNYVSDNAIKAKYFDSVDAGYQWVIAHVATEGDYQYYRECCGNSLKDVKGEALQMAVLRNSFENVRLADWIGR